MQQIIGLSSITDSDIEKVGSRAVNLAKVNRTKILIAPLSFVIPNLIYEEFLLQNRLGIELNKILKTMEKTRESIEFTHLKIRHLFEQSNIPQEFLEELEDSYEALSAQDGGKAQSLLEDEKPVVNLIVSPSYEIDSDALAGTYINIFGFENFLNAIKSCYLSLYSVEHLEYRLNKGIEKFTCGIIVEKFQECDVTIEARSKGVLGNYEIPINVYYGLVDINRTIPKDYFSISRETFGIAQEDIKVQDYQFLKNDASGTLIRRSLGKRGGEQKIINKHIFEISRIIERISALTQIHFKIIILMKGTNFKVFMIEKLENRKENEEAKITNEPNDEKPLADLTNQEIKIIKEEMLQELINAPIEEEKEAEIKEVNNNGAKLQSGEGEIKTIILQDEQINTNDSYESSTPYESSIPTSISSRDSILIQNENIADDAQSQIDIDENQIVEKIQIIQENDAQQTQIPNESPLAQETTNISSDEIRIIKEEQKEPKIIMLDTDDFILSPNEKKNDGPKNFLQSLIDEPIFDDALEVQKKNEHKEVREDEQVEKIRQSPQNIAPKAFADNKEHVENIKINTPSQMNMDLNAQVTNANDASKIPDLNFYMNIIMDIEPSIDQHILNTYQEKFRKQPPEILLALEELDVSFGFPQKEQIFKLKSLKEMLNRGEEINLELFLDITEQLRKIR